jgi:pyrethroid hydrolase
LPPFEARYIDVVWADENNVLKIDVSRYSIEAVERGDSCSLESVTYHDYYPRLAFKILGKKHYHVPYFELPGGDKVNLLKVRDPLSGDEWWIDAQDWNDKKMAKRYETEAYRTVGYLSLVIQNQKVEISNNSTGFTAAELESYLSDFKGDLWSIIRKEKGHITAGVAKEVPLIFGEELQDYLTDFASAIEKVIKSPTIELREIQKKLPLKKVRPVARTFMEIASKGRDAQITSRAHVESPNTPENRYLHFALDRVMYLTRQVIALASRQAQSYERYVQTSISRLNHLDRPKLIDKSVFSQEVSEIERQIERLSNLVRGAIVANGNPNELEHDYILELGRRFGGDDSVGRFFCNAYEGGGHRMDQSRRNDGYVVVTLPERFQTEELTRVLEYRHVRLRGGVNHSESTSENQKNVTRISFFSVTGGRFIKHPLAEEKRRLNRRFKELEEKGWTEQYTQQELKDIINEKNAVSTRLDMARENSTKLDAASNRARSVQERLKNVKRAFVDAGIGREANFPNKMVFVQNPHYASAKSAFGKIMENSGLDESLFESLMAIDQIGLINIPILYERWCLLKIIGIFTDVYGFRLIGDWQKRLINAVENSVKNVEFPMECLSLKKKITLTYEKKLASGRFPDFVLDIRSMIDGSEKRYVLDAKFRDTLSDESFLELIEGLYFPPEQEKSKKDQSKGYSEGQNNKVFIIHPSSDVFSLRTSPLDWGNHSDYGQERMHRYGGIFLSPSIKHGNSLENLQRLIGLILDDTVSYDHLIEGGPAIHGVFCLACGESEPEHLTVERKKTRGGGVKWEISCKSCNHLHINSFCSSCRTRIRKHGYYWTYHRTRAEQPFNIVCPNCHVFLTE